MARRWLTLFYRNGAVQLHIWAEGAGAVTVEQFKTQLEVALRQLQASHIPVPVVPTAAAESPPPVPPSAPPSNVVPEMPSTGAPSIRPSPPPDAQPVPGLGVDTASASSQPNTTNIPNSASQAQQLQRADYVKMQKEREQKQRDERERIRQQIKNDREERRRREELQKRTEIRAVQGTESTSVTATPAPKSRDIRVQVRTFDGSTLRQTFTPSANVSSQIRPWIDSTSPQSVPYDLKLILTPLPNRNIEAAEEEQSLLDLGIQGSCTLVMVPVKGYVESYTGATAGGIVGSAVSGGYNLVAGTAGTVLGGVRSLLGWNGQSDTAATPSNSAAASAQDEVRQSSSNVRVRTLADQRMEAAKKKDQQFYNGNQLNFEPRKDEEKED